MSNQCLYMKNDEVGVIVVCIYIDDTLFVGNQNAIEKKTTLESLSGLK